MGKVKKSENKIGSEVFESINSRTDARIFRNNVGIGYQGTVDKQWSSYLSNKFGARVIVLTYPRVIKFGLRVGSGDYIGFAVRKITEKLIGTKIAQFLSIETKTKTGSASDEQLKWRENINRFCGRAGIARSKEDANSLIDGWY